MITPEQQQKSVVARMQKLHEQHFWGQLILRFRDGELQLVTTEETEPADKFVENQVFPGG